MCECGKVLLEASNLRKHKKKWKKTVKIPKTGIQNGLKQQKMTFEIKVLFANISLSNMKDNDFFLYTLLRLILASLHADVKTGIKNNDPMSDGIWNVIFLWCLKSLLIN